MTVLHSGTTKKYSDNWDQVFGGGKAKRASAPGKKAVKRKASPKKKAKPAPKAATRKKSSRKKSAKR